MCRVQSTQVPCSIVGMTDGHLGASICAKKIHALSVIPPPARRRLATGGVYLGPALRASSINAGMVRYDEPGDESGESMELADALDSAEMVDADAVIEGSATVAATVKMKLNTFCTDPRLRAKLNTIVVDMNRVVAEAYAFANFHITRVLETREEAVPRVDRNFYYRCILAISVCTPRKGTITDSMLSSIKLFDELRDPEAQKVDIREYNQVVADCTISMAAMASNHLWTNVGPRLSRYLSWKHPRINRFHKAMKNALLFKPKAAVEDVVIASKHKKTRKGKAEPANIVQQRVNEARQLQEALAVTRELRELLVLSSSSQFATTAHLTLPLYHKILADTEIGKAEFDAHMASLPAGHKDLGLPNKRRKKFQGRLFNLLPMKSGFTTSHIPISSQMLMGVLRKLGVEKCKPSDDARQYWAKYFNLKLVETENRKFQKRIVTDGYAVGALISCTIKLTATESKGSDLSLIQDVVGREVNPYPLSQAMRWGDSMAEARAVFKEYEDECLVAGVDPGFTDVITVSYSDGRVVKYSSARYYEEAKINYSRRRTKGLNDETLVMTSRLTGGRTAHLAELSAYLRELLHCLPTLLAHRYTKAYRKLRFLRFIHRRKTINRICNMVVPLDAPLTLVGWGDWSGGHASPISRKCAGPTRDISKAVSRRENAMLKPVSEYNTSKLDSNTRAELKNMKAYTTRVLRTGKKLASFNKKVHKVLHCKTSDGCFPSGKETTWDRDVNASRNIMTLFMLEILGRARPAEFCRPTNNRFGEAHLEAARASKASNPSKAEAAGVGTPQGVSHSDVLSSIPLLGVTSDGDLEVVTDGCPILG